jgi:hypothetical protein
MTAGLLVTLPRVLGWGNAPTRLLDASAAGTVVYSVMTRYELGLVKALPMKAHLAIDAVQAGTLLGAAALMQDEDADVRGTLGALGAFELAVTLLSRTEPDVQSRSSDTANNSMPQAGYPEVGVAAASA